MNQYKRRFKKGESIKSFDELIAQKFVYVHEKITHNGWFTSWQIGYAKRMLEAGFIYKAVSIVERGDNNE